MNIIPRITGAAAVTAGALLLAAAPSQAASVSPTVVDGNPTCADLGSGLSELKIDPPKGGTYTSADGAFTVTVTTDGKSFDFSVADDEMVDLAFAKGGSQGGNLYSYAPDGTNADTGLIAPDTGSGSADNAALSHITFCYVPDKVATPPEIVETGPAPEPEPEAKTEEPPAVTVAPEQPAAPAAPAATPAPVAAPAQVKVLGKVVTHKKKKAKKAKRKVKKHVVRAIRTPRFAG
jgi:hypothetical protein